MVVLLLGPVAIYVAFLPLIAILGIVVLINVLQVRRLSTLTTRLFEPGKQPATEADPIELLKLTTFMQDKRPTWLPEFLRSWDFLPEFMRSLEPLDRSAFGSPRGVPSGQKSAAKLKNIPFHSIADL